MATMLSKLTLIVSACVVVAKAVNFTVQSSGGNATSPYQYGIMFEDINYSGDGGVYAELVRNRAFQGNSMFPSNLDFWHPIGGAELSLSNLSQPLSSALLTSMAFSASNGSADEVGFWNEGFWGFPIVSSWQYNGSFFVYGDYSGNVTATLKSNTTGQTYAETSVKVSSTVDAWTQYQFFLNPAKDAPDSNNTLSFTLPASAVTGLLNFNLISLFPPTYNDRPNGLRVDLMEAMAELKPSFFRAPGGNNVEGNAPPYWWDWKKTLGPLVDRPGYPGTWGYENTDGLGLIEYMLWAKDLNMEPVLAIWSGHYLNGDVISKKKLKPYIQSALDELEFLMGDTSTKWGAHRARLGYPDPFPIKFVEVGNEDSLSGGKQTYGKYRFAAFYDAIHATYPDINIMASYYDVGAVTPTFPNTSGDFHEYALPVQMSSQFGYFDNYTAAHPLLLGEYAVIEYDMDGSSSPSWAAGAPRAMFPFWYGSVAEAIFLLSGERNSDKVIGASYAPTFMNLNSWQWIPDMIAYDANPANLVLSTSYYMVKLLSGTRITENLPTTEAEFGPAYWVAGRSNVTGSHILKAVVYNSTGNVPFDVTFEGVGAGATGQLTYLTAPMNASNTIGSNVVKTHVKQITANSKAIFSFKLPEYSVAVMEIGANSAGTGFDYSSADSRQSWKGLDDWQRSYMK